MTEQQITKTLVETILKNNNYFKLKNVKDVFLINYKTCSKIFSKS